MLIGHFWTVAGRRSAGSNPLAAYTPSTGEVPYFVHDSVNDFYYSEAVGVTDRATMYPDSDGVIASSMVPDSTGGLTLVTRGLITYTQDDGDMFALHMTIGGNPLLRFGILSSGTGTGRVFARFSNNPDVGSVYETAPGSYSPGTDVAYSFGAVLTKDRIQLAVEGSLGNSGSYSFAGFPDFSATDWITQATSKYDEDNRIIIMWEGDAGDTALQEMTPPFS